MPDPQDHIIFFDGVCNLCSSSVQFIIKRDSKNRYKFASLQSAYAMETLKTLKAEFHTTELKSIILLEGKAIYTQSTAALRIAKNLDGLWKLFIVFFILPKFIRDGLYDVIARNRYKWFGVKNECWLPSPAMKSKFLG